MAGRKRKFDPTIPKHIDQAGIPAGIYWDGRWGGTWYVLERSPEGKQKWRSVAPATALLSDLHVIAEARAGKTDRNVLRALCEAFEESPQFRKLAKATRTDYIYCRGVVVDLKTKLGKPFGDLVTRKIKRPLVQLLIDAIAGGTERDATGALIPTPSKAVHVQRYLSRLFEWGANRGFNDVNPAEGIELPAERKLRRLPEAQAMTDLVAFARARAGTRGKTGSVAPYLWATIEIAYMLRLRGIEVTTLTDAHALDQGLMTNRRKGSRDNITTWTPRLREAWDYLIKLRSETWAKKKFPVPMRADQRFLVVTLSGDPISKSGFDSAWQRLIQLAMKEGKILPEQRFGAHDLKRRGITDTPGTRGEKQLASGHTNEQMLDVYDYSLPVVRPSGDAS
jgi:hypothetical protein